MLQDKAMIANLNVRAWSARKRDKSAGREVERNHGATDAGNFNKLLVDAVHLKPVVSLSGKLRDSHYAMTLPWGDNGDRLLPSKMYFEYTKMMRDLRGQFDAAVQKFCDDYPTYKQTARKRLGTLYDPADYPDASAIRAKFSAKVSFLPVPEASDFRVELGEEEVATIREDITRQIALQQQEAIKDLWGRLKEVTENIYNRLSDPEAVFRDSLVENAQFACSIAAKLNINDDQALESIRRDIDFNLCQVAPQRLRDDKALRAKVADAAARILKAFPAW